MGTHIWEVVCGEPDIGGDGEYCGDNDAKLDRIKVLYNEVPGGKCPPRAMPTWRDQRCACVAARRAFPPGKTRETKSGRGNKL